MIIISILISIYNYLGYNDYIFSNYTHEVEHSIKPLLICLLYSITGFFFGSINLCDKLKKYIIIIIYLALILYHFIKNKEKLVKVFYNYFIFIIDLTSSCMFIIFAILPFDKIKNKTSISCIKQITRYTGGIYYLHYDIMHLFTNIFNLLYKSE